MPEYPFHLTLDSIGKITPLEPGDIISFVPSKANQRSLVELKPYPQQTPIPDNILHERNPHVNIIIGIIIAFTAGCIIVLSISDSQKRTKEDQIRALKLEAYTTQNKLSIAIR